MNTDPVTLNYVHWLKVFPVLHLLKAARLAFRIRVLIPAALAVCGFLLGPQLQDAATTASSHLGMETVFVTSAVVVLPGPVSSLIAATTEMIHAGSWRVFLILLWNMLLLSVFGVAIARSAALEFCRHSRVGALSALRFSLSSSPDYLLTSTLSIGIVGLFLLPVVIVGWAAWSFPLAASAAMWCWPVILVLTASTVCAALVCVIGWLLSHSAIGADRCSGADALSRSINYVLSHKLLTCWYLCLTTAVAKLSALIGSVIVAGSMSILNARMPGLAIVLKSGGISGANGSEAMLIRWHSAVVHLPAVLQFGSFLSGLAITYVLLRQKEDAIDVREVNGAQLLGPDNQGTS